MEIRLLHPPQIGDVLPCEFPKGGRRKPGLCCPGCRVPVSPGTSLCNRCGTAFVPVTPGWAQIVAVREYAAPH